MEKKELHEINGNIPQSDRKLKKTKPKSLISLENIRFILECLIANFFVISILFVLLPFITFYMFLKKLEYFVLRWFDKSAVALGGEDALWLQESDENRLIITAVLLAERPKDQQKALKNFRQVVYERLVDYRDSNGDVKFTRAKQFIRPGYLQYFFVDDKNFNIDKHVIQYDGARPKTKQELEDIVSVLSGQSLPQDRPPWYFCFIPTKYGDRDAMVFRMHHSIADGVSLSRFLTRILPDHYIPQEERKKFSSYERGFISMKAVFILARTILAQLVRFADKSIIHGEEMTGKKKCTWSEPFDLDLVKRIKNATGTTVNDVVVACLTMAVRKYFQKHGIQSPEDFTASVPVDLSPSSSEIKFQNKFAIVFVKLPSSQEDAIDVLYKTKARIDSFKRSGEPFAMSLGMKLSIDFLPEIATRPLISFISRKATCVLSNVPGPQYFLSVSGNSIKYMTFYPPQRNNIGIGLSIYSYAGQVIIGAQGDEAVLKDPEMITEFFGESIKELESCVLD